MLFLSYFIFSFGLYLGDDSICLTNKSFTSKVGNNTRYQESQCCPHFENVSGKCIACKNGFTSDKGSKCSKCNNGYYGVRCVHECNCPIHSCNHLHGCMLDHSTDDLKTHQQISSTVLVDISPLTELNYGNTHIMIYFVCCCVLTVVIGSGVVCLKRKNKKTKTTTKRYSMKTDGTSNRELQIFPQRENMQTFEDTKIDDTLIYAIGSGSVTVIVIMTISIIIYHRKRCCKHKSRQKRHKSGLNQTQTYSEEQYETFLW